MILQLAKIIEEVKEPAADLGITENELVSFIIVSKFETEIQNVFLSMALKTLFENVNGEAAEKIGKIIGFPTENVGIYDFLDKVSDYLEIEDDIKTREIVSFFNDDVNVLYVIRSCFGSRIKDQS